MSTMSTMKAVRAVGCHFAIAAPPGRLWMEDISDFAGCRVQFTASSAGPCERSRSRDWWREVGENLLDNRPKARRHVVPVVQNSSDSAPRKYHAPMAIMVTCGQSWTVKNGKLAASI
jgi:hypothetical protein